MTIRQRDTNRKELVKAIIRQNGGRIFTVVARRKSPKVTVTHKVDGSEVTKAAHKKLTEEEQDNYEVVIENFMTMTCRTGVTKDLKGGESTISHKDDLVSVNLTNGKGYRCFSAYNVLELRAGGTHIKFKEADVLSFEE